MNELNLRLMIQMRLLYEFNCLMVPIHFEVSETKAIKDIAVLRLGLQTMLEPTDSILILSYLFVAARDVVQKLVALGIL